MTDTQPTAETAPARGVQPTPRNEAPYQQPTRVGHVAAWVGIVAGVVFIVALVFFSGFLIGWSNSDHRGWHRGYDSSRMWPGAEPMERCPMMSPGGMMGPGQMAPGGMMGPNSPMGPGQSPPPTTAPSPRRP